MNNKIEIINNGLSEETLKKMWNSFHLYVDESREKGFPAIPYTFENFMDFICCSWERYKNKS